MDYSQDSDVNDSARASADLKITRYAGVSKYPMPHMSDNEIYLRLGIPDGLQNDGDQPEHYGIVQKEAADPNRSVIRHNTNDPDDGGVSAKLAAARNALTNAQNSNVSGRGPQKNVHPPRPVASTQTGSKPAAPNVGDELKAKKAIIDQYTDAQD